MTTDGFDIRVLDQIEDPDQDCVDVEVFVHGRGRLVGTFVTVEKIRERLRSYKETGECAGGTYFWCSGLVVVRRLGDDEIRRAVQDMLDTDSLFEALDATRED